MSKVSHIDGLHEFFDGKRLMTFADFTTSKTHPLRQIRHVNAVQLFGLNPILGLIGLINQLGKIYNWTVYFD